jgi:ATP-dependent Lhr-like helicase
VTLVPTNTLELVDAAAARSAIGEGCIESRNAPERPLDVLVQHLVSIALGTGFVDSELLAEVRSTWSYRELADADWNWALDFVGRGGAALQAYADYRRVVRGDDVSGVSRTRASDSGIACRSGRSSPRHRCW